ncbi:MAG: hypothetical protein ACLFQV_10155 [Vulcanimicrobiota bacterium]
MEARKAQIKRDGEAHRHSIKRHHMSGKNPLGKEIELTTRSGKAAYDEEAGEDRVNDMRWQTKEKRIPGEEDPFSKKESLTMHYIGRDDFTNNNKDTSHQIKQDTFVNRMPDGSVAITVNKIDTHYDKNYANEDQWNQELHTSSKIEWPDGKVKSTSTTEITEKAGNEVNVRTIRTQNGKRVSSQSVTTNPTETDADGLKAAWWQNPQDLVTQLGDKVMSDFLCKPHR